MSKKKMSLTQNFINKSLMGSNLIKRLSQENPNANIVTKKTIKQKTNMLLLTLNNQQGNNIKIQL